MDFKTWEAIGTEMQSWQIKDASAHDSKLYGLLSLGRKNFHKPRTLNNNALISNKISNTARIIRFPAFKFRLYVSTFAPFEWFGPLNFSKGDGTNRKFNANPQDTYRIRGVSEITAVDDGTRFPYSETRASEATESILWLPLGLTHSDTSECHINDPYSGEYQPNGLYSEKSGVDYHMYGNDDAFFRYDENPISDIDVRPSIWFNYEPQPNPNNTIMHATGSVVGDQFPAVEVFIVDRNNNSVMLGVFQVDAKDTPQWKLPGNNMLPMIKIDLKIMVESGTFTGVFKNDRLISLSEHNNYYRNLSPVTGNPYPPERVRPATYY